ncbi:hypothetical protein GCM10027091_05870 [Streptomyces daliensis]
MASALFIRVTKRACPFPREGLPMVSAVSWHAEDEAWLVLDFETVRGRMARPLRPALRIVPRLKAACAALTRLVIGGAG